MVYVGIPYVQLFGRKEEYENGHCCTRTSTRAIRGVRILSLHMQTQIWQSLRAFRTHLKARHAWEVSFRSIYIHHSAGLILSAIYHTLVHTLALGIKYLTS